MPGGKCFIEDGRIVAAAQEERFTRVKHDSSFPANAIACCLQHAGIGLRDVDYTVFYEKTASPNSSVCSKRTSASRRADFTSFRASMPVWIKQKLFQRSMLQKRLRTIDPRWNGKLLFTEHHQSHAASAFFPSPFETAAVLTMDGVGEWATTSFGVGRGPDLQLLREIHFPHSLGLLYSAFTYYPAGFKVNSGEYKLMGLSALRRAAFLRWKDSRTLDRYQARRPPSV